MVLGPVPQELSRLLGPLFGVLDQARRLGAGLSLGSLASGDLAPLASTPLKIAEGIRDLGYAHFVSGDALVRFTRAVESYEIDRSGGQRIEEVFRAMAGLEAWVHGQWRAMVATDLGQIAHSRASIGRWSDALDAMRLTDNRGGIVANTLETRPRPTSIHWGRVAGRLSGENDVALLDGYLQSLGLAEMVSGCFEGTIDLEDLPQVVRDKVHELALLYAEVVWAPFVSPMEKGVLTAISRALPTPSLAIRDEFAPLDRYVCGRGYEDSRVRAIKDKVSEGRLLTLFVELVRDLDRVSETEGIAGLIRVIERSRIPFEPDELRMLLEPLRAAEARIQGRPICPRAIITQQEVLEILRDVSEDFGLGRKVGGFHPLRVVLADRGVVFIPHEPEARLRVTELEARVRELAATVAGLEARNGELGADNGRYFDQAVAAEDALTRANDRIEGLMGQVVELGERVRELTRKGMEVDPDKVTADDLTRLKGWVDYDKVRSEQDGRMAELERLREAVPRLEAEVAKLQEELEIARGIDKARSDVIAGLQKRLFQLASALAALKFSPAKAGDPKFWEGIDLNFAAVSGDSDQPPPLPVPNKPS